MPGAEYGVDKGCGIGSDGNAETLPCWSTVSLAAGGGTASKTAVAIGALRVCKRAETSAHALRIVALELGPRASLQVFKLC